MRAPDEANLLLPVLQGTGAVIRSLRPAFLLLTPACVMLAIGAAIHDGAVIAVSDIVLVLIAATAAHASANAFNEYFDFHSGLDSRTERTPFSGGSGGLIAAPGAAGAVLVAAIALLAVTVGIGLFFIGRVGWGLLPLGLVGIALILTYTQWINGRPVLCLLAPGIGFGPLMVLGAYFVFAGGYSTAAVVASLVPFFLVNNLLLLNQFPDVDADRSVGRQHFVIAYGRPAGASMYGAMLTGAFTVVVFGVLTQLFSPMALVALVPMAAGVAAWRGARRYADDIEQLVPYMAANVIAAVGTPAVLGIELMLG